MAQNGKGDKRRILVVDDHPVVQRGLRDLINETLDLRTSGTASGAEEALRAAQALRPDLVLLDLALGDGVATGLDVTRQLQSRCPDALVLVLSMLDEKLYAERVLAAGARGFVQKSVSDEHLLECIRRVLAGRLCVSEAVRERLFSLKAAHGSGAAPALLDRLSDREMEVFLLLGQGFEPRHIAEKFALSVKTVETYSQRLKTKLGVESASELRRYAIEWGRTHGAP